MIRKGIISLMMAVAFLIGHAQVSMTVQVPPTGTIMKSQLWNMVLVSTSSQPVTVTMNMALVRKRDNQPVMSVESGPIALNKGTKQLRASDFPSLRYTYFLPVVNRDPNGFLPLGSYTACYTLSALGHGGKEVLAEDCLPLEVEPLAPPMLNMPTDASAVENAYPQLTWIAPSPINMFASLSYELRIVEVLKGQSAIQAAQRNLPLYSTTATAPLLNYPASARSLDTGKLYAWKVIAMDNGEPAGQSEVWTFRISSSRPDKKAGIADAYYKLGRGTALPHVESSGSVRFEYMNDANDSMASYSITEVAAPGKVAAANGILPLKYGQNLVEATLPVKGLKHGTLYAFSFTNSRGEQWGMLFTYADPSKKEQ